MAQYGLPISDDAIGTGPPAQCAGNSNGQAWDELDEGFGAGRGSGSGPDDATTAWSTPDNNNGRTLTQIRCNITGLTDPVSSSGHVMRARVCKISDCSPITSGKQVDMTLVLLEGSSDIASAISTNQTSSWLTITYNLTSGESDAITDYANLKLETYVTLVGGGAGRGGGTSAMEFECPDPPKNWLYGRPDGQIGQRQMNQLIVQ